MKLKINWDDMKCIIDDVEYKLDEFTIDPCMDLKGYMINWPNDKFYRKDNFVLEQNSYGYSLFKLDEDDNIITEWMLYEEITY